MTRRALAFLALGGTFVLRAETVEPVTACALATDPYSYQHKLISVESLVTRGFEDFTLFDPACAARQSTWLEYGGQTASGTIYCCGVGPGRARDKAPVIEGYEIPLVTDKNLAEFDRRLQRWPDGVVRARIVGRFFAPGARSGYGHLGCCSLLAIQQVMWVDPEERPDLDHSRSFDLGKARGADRACGIGPATDVDFLKAQRQSDTVATARQGPYETAEAALASLLKVDPSSLGKPKQRLRSPARNVYEWRRGRVRYTVLASRPYWLSAYAKGATSVIWVAAEILRRPCT